MLQQQHYKIVDDEQILIVLHHFASLVLCLDFLVLREEQYMLHQVPLLTCDKIMFDEL